jgi:hypothetical protein
LSQLFALIWDSHHLHLSILLSGFRQPVPSLVLLSFQPVLWRADKLRVSVDEWDCLTFSANFKLRRNYDIRAHHILFSTPGERKGPVDDSQQRTQRTHSPLALSSTGQPLYC